METQSKGLEEILKRLPSTMDYDKEDYTGVIALDTGSISTEVAGYTTKSWTVSTVQEYPGLMYDRQNELFLPRNLSIQDRLLPPRLRAKLTRSGVAPLLVVASTPLSLRFLVNLPARNAEQVGLFLYAHHYGHTKFTYTQLDVIRSFVYNRK